MYLSFVNAKLGNDAAGPVGQFGTFFCQPFIYFPLFAGFADPWELERVVNSIPSGCEHRWILFTQGGLPRRISSIYDFHDDQKTSLTWRKARVLYEE
jgi:hypothetical protein